VLKALKGTASISGMILFIILGATTFAQILSFSGASSGLVQLITGQGLSTTHILIGMMLFLIFLGIFIDQVSMMMITLPIYMPIITALGVDPVWFGVLFLICMQLGLLSPPFGLLLMTMRGVAPPSVSMGQIFLAVTPYLTMSVLLLVAVFMVPGIATWLPSWMG
jgi:TRAP-type C4-dicarboxylate transport system permease large subunit